MDDGAQGPDRGWVVISIGNPDRGDDAAGHMVAWRLREMLPPDVKIIEQSGESAALLANLAGAKAAILIDACRSGAAPGTIHRLDVSDEPFPKAAFTCSTSTHGLGLFEAIELARKLGQLPPCCIAYAIEAENFEAGTAPSPAVAEAIGSLADRIAAEILARAGQ